MSALPTLPFLKNRTWLIGEWDESDGAVFGYLTYAEQQDLHSYYALTEDLADARAIEHRAAASLLDGSLPQRAGRALSKLRWSVSRLAKIRARLRDRKPSQPPKRQRVRVSKVTVRAIARPEPDLRRLVLALVSAAKAEAAWVHAGSG